MLEDRSGSIWIGIEAGLVRYDLETFTVFGMGTDYRVIISDMFDDGSG